MHYQPRPIDRAVFRAYDIRGVIGTHLDEDAFYTIGKAISLELQTLKRRKIFVARDGRLTSDSLCTALKQGLLESGIDVVDLGAVATPVMYYATCAYDLDCGLMVTGSHNPADYNGIKIILAGKTLVQTDIDALYQRVCQGQFQSGMGTLINQDVLLDYIARIVSDVVLAKPLKVVVDCGNGIAGPVIPMVLEKLGCEVIPLYCDVDGRFPNHHPDPTIEDNLRDLQQAVALHQADIGLAFDGDADRLGVVTNTGEIIWPDRLMMFYARDLLKQVEGATIVFDVKCSNHLARVIKAGGGTPKMCPTGHSIVKSVMKQEQAALAGEMSGHLFFKHRWYGFDDALYSACRLLEIISASPLTVGEQFAAIPNSINTPEIKIPIPEEEKFPFMDRFIREAHFPAAEIIDIDGMRVEFPDGWGLLRASNTTPCLVARFEAVNEERLEAIKNLFKSQLKKIDHGLAIDF